MLTSELLHILCNDRPSKHRTGIRLSSLATVVALFFGCAFLLGLRDLSRLAALPDDVSFQYLLSCLLLLYIAGASLLVKLSKPGQNTQLAAGAWFVGLLLLWLPMLPASRAWFATLDIQPLPLTYWLNASVKLVFFALPWLGLFLVHLRHMAPTRLALSGATAGMLAAVLTTAVAFIGTKEPSLNFHVYSGTTAMAFTALLGMALGPRVIRW